MTTKEYNCLTCGIKCVDVNYISTLPSVSRDYCNKCVMKLWTLSKSSANSEDQE